MQLNWLHALRFVVTLDRHPSKLVNLMTVLVYGVTTSRSTEAEFFQLTCEPLWANVPGRSL